MSRILIAIAAALLFGAALASPGEAQGGWTCEHDFSLGLHGWTVVQGDYSSGAVNHADSAVGADYVRGVKLELGLSASSTLTSMSISYSYTAGSVMSPHNQLNVYSNPPWNHWIGYTGLGSSPYSWSGSKSIAGGLYIEMQASRQSSATYSGAVSISSITLSGTGTAPCSSPTPTPAPTNTPVPTSTPAPTGVAYPTAAPFVGAAGDSWWGNQFNFQFGLQDWRIISGSFTSGSVISADVGGTETLEIEYPLTNARVTGVLANYYASCPHTFEVKDGNTVFEAGSVGSGNQLIDWQGDHVMANGTLRIRLVGSPACSGVSFVLSEVYIEGYGANPTGLQATAIAIQAGDLYGALDEVNDALSSLPQSLGASVPAETGRTLFGYVKWIVSPSSADELAGPFAPAISHMGIFLTVTFGMALVYAIVWAAIWIFRFIVWVFKIILLIIQIVVGVIGSILKFIF